MVNNFQLHTKYFLNAVNIFTKRPQTTWEDAEFIKYTFLVFFKKTMHRIMAGHFLGNAMRSCRLLGGGNVRMRLYLNLIQCQYSASCASGNASSDPTAVLARVEPSLDVQYLYSL